LANRPGYLKVSAKTIAIIQARLGSTRLPRKVLEILGDRTLLAWVVERTRRAKGLDAVVVATTQLPTDDPIVRACEQLAVDCFRGSEDDVLARYVAAAKRFDADAVVRINADNPFIAPEYISELIASATAADDYLGYETREGRPAMLTPVSFFAEWITSDCLRRAADQISDVSQREHVSLGIYTDPDRYAVRFLPMPDFVESSTLRLTLDYPEDLELLREIVAASAGSLPTASAKAIVELVREREDWATRMQQINRKSPKA